jgi:hypothetical protein
MPVVMLVKCEKCGYENFPQHRYCGMCAAPLRIPGMAAPAPSPPPAKTSLPPVQHAPFKYDERPATPLKEAAPRQVSGPSFLGLGQEPAEDKSFSYLFEDETPTHRGRNLVVILLIAAAMAAAIWHWRQDLRVVVDRLLNTLPAATKPAATDKTDSNAPAPATTDSAAGGTSSTPTAASQPGGTATQTPAAQNAIPPATDAATAPPPEASAKTDSTQGGTEAQAPKHSPAENASPKASSAHEESGETADADEAPTPPSNVRKPVTKAARTTAMTSRADDLEAQGEKYLYGNGVLENCTRARTNLLAAAEHSNAQAQSVLGTMYATGHCATRDLPTAYRWFGRSLRQDPKNTRLEKDLQVLWNQMTPGERQLAMRSGR